jgi:hypothetical protein
LQLEFDWLDATKTLFDAYEKALNRSGNEQLVDLQTIGEKIRTAVAPDDGAEIAWSVGGFVGNLTSAGLILLSGPEGPLVLAAWEALVTVYELVRELIGDTSGTPAGDKVTTKMQELSSEVATRLSATANGLDRLRDVIISDYGRLKALGSVAGGPGWSVDVPTTTSTLTTAANAFFSSELMPVAFRPWEMRATTTFGDPTTEGCNVPGYGHSFRGAPATSWLNWHRSDPLGYSIREPGDTPVWALGKYSWSASQYAYPPAGLTDTTFRSQDQGGYGVQLHRFFWEQYNSRALPGLGYDDPEDWNDGGNWLACF